MPTATSDSIVDLAIMWSQSSTITPQFVNRALKAELVTVR